MRIDRSPSQFRLQKLKAYIAKVFLINRSCIMITSLVIKKHNLKEKRGLFRAVYANFAGCSGQLFLIFSCKFPLIAIVRL